MVFAATRHPILLCNTQLCKRLVHWQMMRTVWGHQKCVLCHQITNRRLCRASILGYNNGWGLEWAAAKRDKSTERARAICGLDWIMWCGFGMQIMLSIPIIAINPPQSHPPPETLTRDVFLPVSVQLLLLRRSQLVNSTRTITTTRADNKCARGSGVEWRFSI